jgi:nitrogen regulatory protein PII
MAAPEPAQAAYAHIDRVSTGGLTRPRVGGIIRTRCGRTEIISLHPLVKIGRMELLVCVINQEGKLEEVLSRLVELRVSGATVVNSWGMARHLTQTPVFAGLQDLLSRAHPENSTIFSVIESQEKLKAAIDMIMEVCGDMSAAGTGILFTVPLNRVVGLRQVPESDSS